MRREFLGVLGGAAAWPISARAQQPPKVPRIGFLGASTAAAMKDWAVGWVEGRNVAIEYRWAEGRSERFAEIADEFVRLNVDVIVTYGNAAVAAAKQATSVTPIVFAGVGDPVGGGLVTSPARPGGNVEKHGAELGLADARGVGREWFRKRKRDRPTNG
jgi:ABC transporter substrate binding protein